MLWEVRENSWNLCTLSLLMENSNYKNPHSFLYSFGHATFVINLKFNTVPCRIFGRNFIWKCCHDLCAAFSRLHLMWAVHNRRHLSDYFVKENTFGIVIHWPRYWRWARCIICHIAYRPWQNFKMTYLWKYGRELCFHAQNDKENCVVRCHEFSRTF